MHVLVLTIEFFVLYLFLVTSNVLSQFPFFSLSFHPSLLAIFIILIFPLPVFIFVLSCLLVTDILHLSFQMRCKLCRTSIMHLVTACTVQGEFGMLNKCLPRLRRNISQTASYTDTQTHTHTHTHIHIYIYIYCLNISEIRLLLLGWGICWISR